MSEVVIFVNREFLLNPNEERRVEYITEEIMYDYYAISEELMGDESNLDDLDDWTWNAGQTYMRMADYANEYHGYIRLSEKMQKRVDGMILAGAAQ
jgi:hypothetical protein